MYSGKIAVPPGGGGIVDNNFFSTYLFKLSTILFETLRVAFRRLSGGVSLQVVISIISEICLQHIHIVVHFISQHEIGEKKIKQKSRQIKLIFKINVNFFVVFPWLQEYLK
jgi:hypothetical protein